MSDTSPTQAKRRSRGAYFTPRRIARIAILVAISAVGAFIRLPSPTGTVALDAAPGFVAAAAFGPGEGSIVGALGHLFSALITGFPLTLPVHLLIAAATMVWVGAFGLVARKVNIWAAIPVGILINGVGGSALMIPVLGVGAFAALVVPLTIGATINIVIAVAVVKVLDSTGMSSRGKKSAAVDADTEPPASSRHA